MQENIRRQENKTKRREVESSRVNERRWKNVSARCHSTARRSQHGSEVTVRLGGDGVLMSQRLESTGAPVTSLRSQRLESTGALVTWLESQRLESTEAPCCLAAAAAAAAAAVLLTTQPSGLLLRSVS